MEHYLRRLADGSPWAFDEAFSGVPLDALHAAYLASEQRLLRRVPYAPAPIREPQVREMRPDEVRRHWDDLAFLRSL